MSETHTIGKQTLFVATGRYRLDCTCGWRTIVTGWKRAHERFREHAAAHEHDQPEDP